MIMLLETFIIPFLQSLLYDMSKSVLMDSTDSTRKKANLKTAIKMGVMSVLTYTPNRQELIDSITDLIFDSFIKFESPDIYDIIKREFEQRGEKNLDALTVSGRITTEITRKLLEDEVLTHYLTVSSLKEFTKTCNDLLKNLNENSTKIVSLTNTVERINKKLDLITNIQYYLLHTDKYINNHILMITTSRHVPIEYKNHILNPLFLEKNLLDNMIATLKDVYIINDYYILDFPINNSGKIFMNVVNFIIDFIDSNLIDKKYNTNYSFPTKKICVLFIKGAPGCGKSSLFYYLAFLKSHDETFFPQKKFSFVKLIDIYDSVGGALNIENPLRDIENFLGDSDFKNSVLVLDGLDEICVARDLNISTYCFNLVHFASRYNNFKIIITTRLNYVNIIDSRVINIQLINLSSEKLNRWITKYFDIHPSLNIERKVAEQNLKLLDEEHPDKLRDIFAIPLLFYMIVATRIDLSKINSIGELYDCVFRELKERNYNETYDNSMTEHGINAKISEKLARQIAIEISYVMYRENKLLLRISSDELSSALESAYKIDGHIKNKDKEDIEQLFPITFFYKNSVDVVEFAHKSIMEFFVAEKMYQALSNGVGTFRNFINTYIINPIIITNEVLAFLSYFVESRSDNTREIRKTYSILDEMKRDILDKSFYQTKNVAYDFETPKVIFKVYWYFARQILKCPLNELNNLIKDIEIQKYIVGALSIQDSGAIPILDNKTIVLNFSQLDIIDFQFAYIDLSNSLFNGAKFSNCTFSYANMAYSSLQNLKIDVQTKFLNCNFDNVSFSVSKFLRTDVTNADVIFSKCSFDGTIVSNTDCRHIRFEYMGSMHNTAFIDSTFNLSQILELLRNPIQLHNTTVIIAEQDITNKEIMEIKKEEKENRRQKILEIAASKFQHRISEDLIKEIKLSVDNKLQEQLIE